MYTCRECEQAINQASEICPYCGADLTAPSAEESERPAKKKNVARIVLLWGIVLAMVWAVAWFALPWRLSGTRFEAESRARDALVAVQEALRVYQASEGGFPSSLEALGDRVRAAAQTAQSAHYSLQYTPGKPDPDGRVKSYGLVARAGNFGYLNFYTDESGILRMTAEDRTASAEDPAIKPNP